MFQISGVGEGEVGFEICMQRTGGRGKLARHCSVPVCGLSRSLPVSGSAAHHSLDLDLAPSVWAFSSHYVVASRVPCGMALFPYF